MRRLAVAITMLALPAVSACRTAPPSPDCFTAIERHWPAGQQATARRIVWRESRNIPTAANRRSTARGCFQLLQSLHAWRYTTVGCRPADWADPDCNTRAALALFESQGWRPWASR